MNSRTRRQLSLDKDEGWIFGVCAGLANYLRTDAAIVRVGVVVAALFFPKIVIAAYLVAWLILDDRAAPEKVSTRDRYERNSRY